MAKRFNPNSITNEELITSLCNLSDKLNRTPSQSDMSKFGDNNTKRLHLYRKRFGSIKNAQKIAGLVENKSGADIKYTDSELIQQIQSVANILNKTPSQNEIKKYGKYPIGAYKRRFGTYNKAVVRAGLKPNTVDYTEQEIIDDILRLNTLLGRAPKIDEFSKMGSTVNNVTAINRLGCSTWNALLKKCGLTPNTHSTLSDNELKEELLNLRDKLGYTPGYHDMSMYGKYSAETYAGRFGTYLKALEYFGFDYTSHNQWQNCHYSRGKDGILYRSKFESGFANILLDLKKSNNIEEYEYEKLVCSNKKWTCDFFVVKDNDEYWIELDGMLNHRKQSYKDNNDKIKYYIKHNFNYHIIEYKRDVKGDLFNILFDKSKYDINSLIIEYNLRRRKKQWKGSIDFPEIDNIKTSIDCTLQTRINWKHNVLTSKYLRTINEDDRDEIAKDLLNFFVKYDFNKMKYDDRVIDRDVANLIENTLQIDENNVIMNNLNFGTKICKKYFPHIIKIKSDKQSICDALNDKSTLFKIIRNRIGNTYLEGNPPRQSPFNITPAMIMQGAKVTGLASRGSIFNPMLSKMIYDKWVNDNDVVYDYSSGYGGRLLGFWASKKNAKYIGTDVEPETYNGLNNMVKDFNINAKIFNIPSEEFVPPELINFAFSSPPYFDHEIYSRHKNQSCVKYKYLDEWLDKYWDKTVKNIKKSLSNDGVLAVNAGNFGNKKMSKFNEKIIDIIINNGFVLIDMWKVKSNSFSFKKKSHKKTEPIHFFKIR